MRPDDLVGYQFRADFYCEEHILPEMGAEPKPGNVELGLEWLADERGIERENESSFDSGDFPKVLFRDAAEPYDGVEEDTSTRCGNCGKVLADMPAIPWRAAADWRRDVDDFLRGYMEAALWSSNDPDTETPLDDKYSTADIANDLRKQMRQECAAFVRANGDNLHLLGELTGRDWASHGHDLWLTRNGHGAGYWDRYMEASPDGRSAAETIGKTLSEAARELGEFVILPDGEEVSRA